MEEKIEITPKLLAELKDKAEKATPGSWLFDKEAGHIRIDPKRIYAFWVTPSPNRENNAEFVSAANPAVILALIDKIEEDKSTIEALRDDMEINEIIRQHHYNFLAKLQKALEINIDDKFLIQKIDDMYMEVLRKVRS